MIVKYLATKTLNYYKLVGFKRTIAKVISYILHYLLTSQLAGTNKLAKVLTIIISSLRRSWTLLNQIRKFAIHISKSIKIIVSWTYDPVKLEVVARLENVIIFIGSSYRCELLNNESSTWISMTFGCQTIESPFYKALPSYLRTCRFIAVITTDGDCTPGRIQVSDPVRGLRTVYVQAPSAYRDFQNAAKYVWSIGEAMASDEQEILTKNICPLITRQIREYWKSADNKQNMSRFIDSKVTPQISIVVPIHGNLTFTARQHEAICKTVGIPSEIIYVLDCPEEVEIIKNTFRKESTHVVGIKSIYHCEYFGFAFACNTGARHAEADAVVFLNSCVLPDSSAWGAVVVTTLRAEAPCLLGARLLSENGAIQHVGTVLRQGEGDDRNVWWHQHPMKGMSVAPSVSHGISEVEAVSGAWLACTCDIFSFLGGFSGDYPVGDYEDADLCLLARSRNIKVRINYDIRAIYNELSNGLEGIAKRISKQNGRIVARKWFSDQSPDVVCQ